MSFEKRLSQENRSAKSSYGSLKLLIKNVLVDSVLSTNLYGKLRCAFSFVLISFEPLGRFGSFSIPNFSGACPSICVKMYGIYLVLTM